MFMIKASHLFLRQIKAAAFYVCALVTMLIMGLILVHHGKFMILLVQNLLCYTEKET